MNKDEEEGTGDNVYEMLWDCEFCGSKKLLGQTHRHCPNCGAKQNPARRYFPSDEEKIAVKDHVFVGADKSCQFCHNPASAKANCCPKCGASLAGASEVQRLNDEVRGAGEIYHAAPVEGQRGGGSTPPEAKKPKMSRPKWLFLIMLGALVAFILVAIFWKKESAILLAGHHWEREIRIESFGARNEATWCDQMPSDAFSVVRNREVRSQQQVPNGEECSMRRVDNGDGTFRQKRECRPKYRNEPVYDYRCRFAVNRWGHSRSAKASGASLKDEPRWPDPNPALQPGNCIGCEREGGREESYYLDFVETKSNKQHSCKVNMPTWKAAPLGGNWIAKIGAIGKALDCASLKPQ